MTRGLGGESPANVQRYLKGIDYPAEKEDLVDRARQNDAPDDIIEALESFDEHEYGGPQDVMKEYGRYT